jgi:hypothetical protein
LENKKHEGNYKGSKDMSAENQDMEFVNDVLENAKNTTPVNIMKDDLNENREDKVLTSK